MKTTAIHDPGLYWHVHHEHLVGYMRNYEERAEYIRKNKPQHEIATRLRLMQPIRGVPESLVKLSAELAQATDSDWPNAYGNWYSAYCEALPALEALHAQECKDCPWDGRTIFPVNTATTTTALYAARGSAWYEKEDA